MINEIKNFLIKQLDMPELPGNRKKRIVSSDKLYDNPNDIFKRGFRLGKTFAACQTLKEIVRLEEKYMKLDKVYNTMKDVINNMPREYEKDKKKRGKK